MRLKNRRTAVVVIPKFIKKTARKDIQQQQHCRQIIPSQTLQYRETIRGGTVPLIVFGITTTAVLLYLKRIYSGRKSRNLKRLTMRFE